MRELEGALRRTLIYAELSGLPLTPETAASALDGLGAASHPRPVAARHVLDCTSAHFAVPIADLTGSRRDAPTVHAPPGGDVPLAQRLLALTARNRTHPRRPRPTPRHSTAAARSSGCCNSTTASRTRSRRSALSSPTSPSSSIPLSQHRARAGIGRNPFGGLTWPSAIGPDLPCLARIDTDGRPAPVPRKRRTLPCSTPHRRDPALP